MKHEERQWISAECRWYALEPVRQVSGHPLRAHEQHSVDLGYLIQTAATFNITALECCALLDVAPKGGQVCCCIWLK